MERRPKVFLDMDIGDEVDDALALYMAMFLNFEIVGVTTVFRNTRQRAVMAKKLLKTYGQGCAQVPVFAGYGQNPSLPQADYPDIPHWTEDLDDPEYAPDGTDPEKAVEHLISCCEAYGKDLTLIAIGPFTNIARALEKRPQALSGIGRVVIMGGAYFRQYADWNVMCDVEAAEGMFRGLSNLHCIGADVTHQLEVSSEDLQRLLTTPGATPAAELIRRWLALWEQQRKFPYPLMLHDPLAVYYAACPQVCRMVSACVAVLTEGYGRGMTLNVDAYRKAPMNPAYRDFPWERKAMVAESVCREDMMEAFMACFP